MNVVCKPVDLLDVFQFKNATTLRTVWQQPTNNLPLFVRQIAERVPSTDGYGSAGFDFGRSTAES